MEEVGGICSNPELPSVEEPAAIVSEYQPSDAERASPSAFSKPHERVRLPLRIRGKPNHLKPGTMPVLGIEASIRSFWTKQLMQKKPDDRLPLSHVQWPCADK